MSASVIKQRKDCYDEGSQRFYGIIGQNPGEERTEYQWTVSELQSGLIYHVIGVSEGGKHRKKCEGRMAEKLPKFLKTITYRSKKLKEHQSTRNMKKIIPRHYIMLKINKKAILGHSSYHYLTPHFTYLYN